MKRKRLHKLSGWTIPLVYAAVAVVVGQTFPRLEHYFLPGLVSTMSPSAAMAICGAVASGMITLTGVVFSLVFVMMQFSATAYSPRLVLWVARDPVMSHALGMFNATFLYALTVIAWVDRSASGRVPFLSSWLVVMLLLGSMALLIALITRIRLLQVGQMLIFTGRQGRQAIAELYQSTTPLALDQEKSDHAHLPVTQTVRHSGRPQVIQAIHTATLVELATASDAVIEIMSAVGDTLLEETPLLRVRGGRQPLDESALRSAIEIGDERTFEQDPKYALRLVVDIAIKALSPAINDPTTAVQALDQIEDLLLRLGRCALERGAFTDPGGKLRVLIPFPTWDDFLRLALDEIRAYGADSVQVMRRMKALIKNLTSVLPAERHPALEHWEQRLRGSIDRSFADAEEKRDASIADRQGLGIAPQETSG
jgi:uncharacterized membrane protein